MTVGVTDVPSYRFPPMRIVVGCLITFSLFGVLAAAQVAWRPGPTIGIGTLLLVHVPHWIAWTVFVALVWSVREWTRGRALPAVWVYLLSCPLVIFGHAAFVAWWDRVTLGGRIQVGWTEIVRRHLASSALYEVLGYAVLVAAVELSTRRERNLSTLEPAAAPTGTRNELVVRSANSVARVSVDEVVYLEASGNYVRVFTGERVFTVRASLASMAALLDPRFIRVHRSRVVNRDHVAKLQSRGRHQRWLELRSGRKLKISPAGWRALASLFREQEVPGSNPGAPIW